MPKPTTPVNHCGFKQWRKLTSFSLSLSVCLSVCLSLSRCLSVCLFLSLCLGLSLSLSFSVCLSLSHCLPVSVFLIRAGGSLSLSLPHSLPPSLPNLLFEFCCCYCCCVVLDRADIGFYERINIKNFCYIKKKFKKSIFAPRRIRI